MYFQLQTMWHICEKLSVAIISSAVACACGKSHTH